MRVKIFAMVIAAAFLFAGVNTSFAQEKVAPKAKTEKTDAKKEAVKEVSKAKTAKTKAKAHKCTDKEKESCTKSCEQE